jgi:lipid-A-disaccharide synthase
VREGAAPHVVVVAGEASGDQHAADLVRELRKLEPSVVVSGMGGQALREAGVELVVDSTDLAVVGVIEVLARYGQIRRALSQLKRHLEETRPQLVVLVDYVEFNLRLAKAAKAVGIKVLFYVSPQVWAWRPHRIQKIGAVIDAMAVLFPFEVEVYKRNGIPVRYVGNPVVDQVQVSESQEELRRMLGLALQRPVLGLFPGSRHSEIRRHWPVMLQACEKLVESLGSVQLVAGVAAGVNVQTQLAPVVPAGLNIKFVEGKSHQVMAASDALMISSGTATLEAGLLQVPMAILYRVSPLSYAILKRFILVPDIGLVNIVAGHRIAQEFVQDQATPANLALECARLLSDTPYREHMRARLGVVREKLGEGGGSRRVAEMAKELLDTGGIAC